MKTPEQHKKEIQSELDKMGKEIADLTKRREDLLTKRDSLTQGIESQTRSIGDALLGGRDTGTASDALARDKALLESVGAAITQADQRLTDLSLQFSDKKNGLVMIDFNRLADEAYIFFLDNVVDLFRKADEAAKQLETKFAEMDTIGQAAGAAVENDDHLRNLRSMHNYLIGSAFSAESVSAKLNHIETSFPATLKLAREKKSK